MIKIVNSNSEEVRAKLFTGVNKAADIVRITLGPAGRNVAIQKIGTWPLITNDGVTVLKKIELEDEIENEGAIYLANAAARTSEIAGDGTTTTAVLVQRIINDIQKSKPQEGKYPTLRKEIHEWKDKVIEEIEKRAKTIETEEELYAVALSAGEDEAMAHEIAKIAHRIGAEGFIAVDDSGFTETKYETIDGMYARHVKVHYAHTVTNQAKGEAVLDKEGDAYVPLIITNYDFTTGGEIYERPSSGDGIIKKLQKVGYKRVAIIAPKFDDNAGRLFLKIAQETGFMIVPLKASALTTDQLEDIAVYTGGKFIDKHTNDSVAYMEVSDCGRAEKVTANPFHTIIIGGQGNKEKVAKRITEIEQKIKDEQLVRMRKKMERRISSLKGGFGIITVGAETDVERMDKKRKIENAVNSTLAALDEGIVRGGGITLKEIAEELPHNVLTSALKAPYEQIQENAGEPFEVPENIYDAVKVTKTALKKACSIAGELIMVGGTIATKRKTLFDELQDQIIHDKRLDHNMPPKDRDWEPGSEDHRDI